MVHTNISRAPKISRFDLTDRIQNDIQFHEVKKFSAIDTQSQTDPSQRQEHKCRRFWDDRSGGRDVVQIEREIWRSDLNPRKGIGIGDANEIWDIVRNSTTGQLRDTTPIRECECDIVSEERPVIQRESMHCRCKCNANVVNPGGLVLRRENRLRTAGKECSNVVKLAITQKAARRENESPRVDRGVAGTETPETRLFQEDKSE